MPHLMIVLIILGSLVKMNVNPEDALESSACLIKATANYLNERQEGKGLRATSRRAYEDFCRPH